MGGRYRRASTFPDLLTSPRWERLNGTSFSRGQSQIWNHELCWMGWQDTHATSGRQLGFAILMTDFTKRLTMDETQDVRMEAGKLIESLVEARRKGIGARARDQLDWAVLERAANTVTRNWIPRESGNDLSSLCRRHARADGHPGFLYTKSMQVNRRKSCSREPSTPSATEYSDALAGYPLPQLQ